MRDKVMSLRLAEYERNFLKSLSEISGLTPSQLMRQGLKQLMSDDSFETNEEIARLQTINKLNILIKEIKELRWLGHVKRDAERHIMLAEKIIKDEITQLNKTDMAIKNMSKKDLMLMIAKEHQILALIKDL